MLLHMCPALLAFHFSFPSELDVHSSTDVASKKMERRDPLEASIIDYPFESSYEGLNNSMRLHEDMLVEARLLTSKVQQTKATFENG